MATGFFVGPCCRCKSEMWLPTALYEAAQRTDRITFYCPFGHPQVFSQAESEAEKLRRERDQLKQSVAYYEDSLREARKGEKAATKLASTRKGVITKLRNRAGAGTCPCCHRTFRQMTLHMQSKHPGFRAEQVA